jgi:arabinogalactan endo-1,4-beta-galactosidase
MIPLPTTWLMGFDASNVSRIEARGGIYRDAQGMAQDPFTLLAQEYAFNIIRLRVWHNPADGYSGKADMLALAQRAQEAGLGILLDVHYSDVWADPAHQQKPAAWEEMSFTELEQLVYHYSLEVVGDLIAQGTPPQIVQIGNEIGNGLLWPDGRVGGAGDADTQWRQMSTLVNAGIKGVRAAGSTAQIMIHLDTGGEKNASGRWFFDHLSAANVPYDIIGLSYYPQWHGDMDAMSFSITDLRSRYNKTVIVVETAYPWTLGWADWTQNVLGNAAQLHPGYPATPQGQRRFLSAVISAAQAAGASGVFYWGGDWIATAAEDTDGSPWENQALFDFDSLALPALNVSTNN